jgi:hypothetical protein
MKFKYLALIAIIAILTATVQGATNLIEKISSIASPQGIDEEFYTVNEGQMLTYGKSWGDTQTMWFNITTNSNPSGNPPGLPPGATMPWVYGFATPISTTFSWTPTYCQSNPLDYSFRVRFWSDDTPSQTNVTNITVTNINRAPHITTNYSSTYYIPVGERLILGSQATDIDNLECNESAFIDMGYTLTPKNGTNATEPDLVFDQVVSGNALLVVGPFTSTNIGRWDLTFKANDGGIEFNSTIKNMTVVVYQPASRTSCGYDKKRGWLACS